MSPTRPRAPGRPAHDLLITGARVLDPGSGFDAVTDVAVRDGVISEIWPGLDAASAAVHVDGTGMLLVPGLIDLHTHLFAGGSYWGIRPDPLAAVSGVTTWVDAGSAGAFTIDLFADVLQRCAVRTRAFLNISGLGLAGQTGESVTLVNVDVQAATDAVAAHRELICGIKVRIDRNAVGPSGLEPLRRGLDVAERTGLPLMVHVSHAPPSAAEVLPMLRPGDILTHCFTGVTAGLVDDGKVTTVARAAYDRGVVFDLGHGSGGFDFGVAEVFTEQGMWPHVVSTDLHVRSLPGPAFDLPSTLIKMVALGMPFAAVLQAATTTPAGLAGLPDGHATMTVGAPADLAMFQLIESPTVVTDAHLHRRIAPFRLVNVATFVDGRLLPVSMPDDPPGWIARTQATSDALARRRAAVRDVLVTNLVGPDDLTEQYSRDMPAPTDSSGIPQPGGS
jgi:dihydroorotase